MTKLQLFLFCILIILTKENSFETKIFWNLATSQPNKNIFYSPFSLELAIVMAYEGTFIIFQFKIGAENSTLEQIAKAFSFDMDKNIERKEIKSLLQSINDSQTKMRTQEYKDIEYFKKYQPNVNLSEIPNSYFYMRTANSLWPDKQFSLKAQYASDIQCFYNGEIASLDYKQAEQSRQIINNWVENKTENKIQDLLIQGSLNPDTKLVIVNALYFKAAWQDSFESSFTTQETFYLENGGTNEVQMMKSSGHFNFYEDKILKMIELPFKNSQASFFVILPTSSKNKLELLQQNEFDQNQFLTLQTKMKHTYIRQLWLPKFKIETQMSLRAALVELGQIFVIKNKLGIIDAFNSKANFSSISPDFIYISDIIQKTYIDVQESGVEAAAATAITFEATSMPVGNSTFLANRPFLFCIQFNAQKQNLFFGAIKELQNVNLNSQNQEEIQEEKEQEKPTEEKNIEEQQNQQKQNQEQKLNEEKIDEFETQKSPEINSSSEISQQTKQFGTRLPFLIMILGLINLIF